MRPGRARVVSLAAVLAAVYPACGRPGGERAARNAQASSEEASGAGGGELAAPGTPALTPAGEPVVRIFETDEVRVRRLLAARGGNDMVGALSFANATLDVVLHALGVLGHVDVECGEGVSARRVSISLHDVTVSQAVRVVMREAGLRARVPHGGTVRFELEAPASDARDR